MKLKPLKLKPLTSAQIRAARALLRWSAEDLARESTLGVTTIRRAELTEAQTSMTAANDLAVRRALEAAGVEFIDGNGGGPGVRLRKAHQQDAQAAGRSSRRSFRLLLDGSLFGVSAIKLVSIGDQLSTFEFGHAQAAPAFGRAGQSGIHQQPAVPESRR
jgi:transcriptional regulator with XRE-family HTH domain